MFKVSNMVLKHNCWPHGPRVQLLCPFDPGIKCEGTEFGLMQMLLGVYGGSVGTWHTLNLTLFLFSKQTAAESGSTFIVMPRLRVHPLLSVTVNT